MKRRWLGAVIVAGAFLVPAGARAGEARTIEIAVTKNGFEPARVKVTKGVPLKLVVTRSPGDTKGGGDAMMGGGMMEGGMMGGSMEEMSTIHRLLSEHDKIQRSVKDIPNGVETTTTSSDPKLATLIREHVRQMKERIENGQPIRQMDPLFREIFANHEHIHMSIEDVPGACT